MRSLPLPRPRAILLALAVLAAAVAALFAVRSATGGAEHARACPPGYLTRDEQAVLARAEQRFARDHGGAQREEERAPAVACAPRSHPESATDFWAAKRFV